MIICLRNFLGDNVPVLGWRYSSGINELLSNLWKYLSSQRGISFSRAAKDFAEAKQKLLRVTYVFTGRPEYILGWFNR